MDDGDVGSTDGNNTPSDQITRDRHSRRDRERLRDDLERFGGPPPEIPAGAPLAPPPVIFSDATRAGASGHGQEHQAAQPVSPLRVVDGGDYPEAEEQSARSLSPSTAAAIGDLATAMVAPFAGGFAARNTGVFVAAALIVLIARARGRSSGLTEREITGFSPVAAALAIFAMTLTLDWHAGALHALSAAGIGLAAGATAALILNRIHERFVHTRVAVIGTAAHAHDLAWSLANEGNSRFTVVGYVGRDSAKENLRDLRHVSFKVRRLGLLADLSHIVARHDIDLLVLPEGRDRLEVFERAAVCTERYRTRLVGLLAFEEHVFQRVSLDQLNIAWMQHIMHPGFRPAPRIATRAIDLTCALFLGVITAPAWIVAAIAVKLADRGPVFERRRSVGERGRSFSIRLFRTTRPPDEEDLPSTDGLPTTRVGRVLRHTHLDAVPLLLNVARGDMSLVGPRPARPRDVTRLEQEIPFYGRRHLLKPGITGWAQLRSGYGTGEDAGEAAMITLSRDLYYLKHQSLFLYSYILVASLWAALTGSLQLRAHRADNS